MRRREQLNRWMRLQRERALMLMQLREVNEAIEDMRPELQDPPLDNFTIKLGGTDEQPGISGLWLESYLKQALANASSYEDELATGNRKCQTNRSPPCAGFFVFSGPVVLAGLCILEPSQMPRPFRPCACGDHCFVEIARPDEAAI